MTRRREEDALLGDGFDGFEADKEIRCTDGDAAVPAGLFAAVHLTFMSGVVSFGA